MFQYHCLNPISPVGLEKFPGKYENTEELAQADAILVRSADMHSLELADKTVAVARFWATKRPRAVCSAFWKWAAALWT